MERPISFEIIDMPIDLEVKLGPLSFDINAPSPDFQGNFRILEDDFFRLLEDGSFRLLE
jgi:hypothetical protein